MSKSLHEIRFPAESEEYRSARNELLEAEIELRSRMEEVAALRRKLPLGGQIPKDYVFEQGTGQIKLSELFEPDKPSLIIYSYMFGPDVEQPCPMCTSFLDGLDRYAPHLTQRVNLAVVAKSPAERLGEWASARGWTHLRLLSSEKNTYNSDYHGETPEGNQLPTCNVFSKTPEGIFHFYTTEVLWAPVEGHARHIDLLWPIWNFFDLTPEGRGADWLPRLTYD